MLARLKSTFQLTRGEKAYIVAYAIVISVAAGLTVYVLAGLENAAPQPGGAPLYSIWTVIAGIVGGALSLYAARGWLGGLGGFGFARALIGATAAALIAAIIAGSLIMPVYGTFFAPVMLATEFAANPLLAIGWYAAMLVAHFLMTVLTRERTQQDWQMLEPVEVTTSLSALSRAQLYHLRD